MEDDLDAEEVKLVDALMRWIDPNEIYIIIIGGAATAFTSSRLHEGLPYQFVGHGNEKDLRPVRDCSILHVVKDRPGHNEIANADAHMLVEEGVATSKDGADITIGEIKSAAKMDILARLDEQLDTEQE